MTGLLCYLSHPGILDALHIVARVEGTIWVVCDTVLLAALVDLANSCRLSRGLAPRRWFFRISCATGLGAAAVGAAPNGAAFDYAVIAVATAQFLMAGFLLLAEARRAVEVLEEAVRR